MTDPAAIDCANADSQAAAASSTDPVGFTAAADRNAWRATLWVTAGFAAFGALWILFVGQFTYDVVYGTGLNARWTEAYDIWSPVFAARTILSGGYLQPYTANPEFVAMPGYAILNLPLALIAEAFDLGKLVTNVRVGDAVIPVSQTGAVADTRSAFALVYGAWAVLWSIPYSRVVRLLAWDLGARRRLWTLQVAAIALGFVPMVLVFGHIEDALVLALVLFSIVQCRRASWTNVAICLTFALSLKQSAVLVIPLFFFFVPKGSRIRFVTIAVSLPLLLVVGAFVADFDAAYRALVTPPTFPTANVARQAWFLATEQVSVVAGGYRIGAVLLALTLAVWLRRNRDVALLTAGVGLAYLVRLPIEAVTFPYYLSPALVVAAIYERRRSGRSIFAVASGLAALGMYWWAASKSWWFWPAEATFLACATWPMWVDVARRRVGGDVREFDVESAIRSKPPQIDVGEEIAGDVTNLSQPDATHVIRDEYLHD